MEWEEYRSVKLGLFHFTKRSLVKWNSPQYWVAQSGMGGILSLGKIGLFHFTRRNGTVQILPSDNIPPIPLWATQYLYNNYVKYQWSGDVMGGDRWGRWYMYPQIFGGGDGMAMSALGPTPKYFCLVHIIYAKFHCYCVQDEKCTIINMHQNTFAWDYII